MKKLFLLLSALIISSISFAQAPQGINYQGVARNNFGAAIANANIGVQFKIHQGGASGAVVYSEVYSYPTIQTDTFGLYTRVIGAASGSGIGTFASIPWAGGNLWVEVLIDMGTGFQSIGASQLQSVPYALYSGSSSSGVTSVSGAGPITATTSGTNVTIGLGSVGAPTNTYGAINAFPIIQTDADGRVSSATTTQTVVTSVNGIAANPVTVTTFSTGAVTVSTNTVIAGNIVGSATAIPVITYDSYGRITGVATSTISSSGGTVTNVSVAGTTPITITNPSTTPTLSMNPANSTTDGYLSQTDWNNFNNKVSLITNGSGLTSTSVSGSYTISATNGSPMWNANQLQGQPVSTATPVLNNVLQFDATGQWSPANIPVLPASQLKAILWGSPSGWAATNPANVSTDGNSIQVVNTNTLNINPSATFSSVPASGSFPVLKVNADNSQGYAIAADNASGAAIVATSSGPYTIGADITNTGSGDAIGGGIKNFSWGNAISGYVDLHSTGHAGFFYYDNNTVTGTDTVVQVINKGSGYSASFNGGQGIQTDKIKINGPTTPTVGFVLTATSTSGDADWKPAAGGGVTSVSVNSPLNITGSVASPTVNIQQATSVQDGYLSKIDWNNFNAKLSSALSSGQIFVGNGGVATPTAMNGDATITSTGSVTVKGLQGTPVSVTTPTVGQVLQFVGGNWLPQTPPGAATGTNGLSGSGVISLGGALTGNTTVSQAANNMVFNATSGNFQINNSGNGAEALYVSNTSGGAAIFALGNSGQSINGSSSGVNSTIVGSNSGTGSAGTFTINNTGSGAAAIVAGTNGTLATSAALKLNGALDATGVGNSGDILSSQGVGASPKWLSTTSIVSAGGGWSTGGNATVGGNFLGTTNAQDLVLKTSLPQNIIFQTNGAIERMRIDATGNVGIGIAPTYPLDLTSANATTSFNSVNTGNGSAASFSINSAGSTASQVVSVSTGATGNPVRGISVNLSGASNSGDGIHASTSGTGNALYGSTSNSGNAIGALTTGNGNAVNASSSGSGAVINANTTGAGQAGNFVITNAGNVTAALIGSTNGNGPGVNGYSTGTGNAGAFNISNSLNVNPALTASTNGSGPALNLNNTGTGALINATTGSSTVTAVSISNTNASNTQPAVSITQSGSGFAINAQSAAGTAINASNSGGAGSGATINSLNSGTVGNAGNFVTNNSTNTSPTLSVTTNAIGGMGVQALNTATSGGAGSFQINNTSNNNPALAAISAGGLALGATNNGGAGAGSAANFNISNGANASTALVVNTFGAGNSAAFTGGAGLKTDAFTMTNGSANGAVLISNATGNASWAAPVNFSVSNNGVQTINSGPITIVNFPVVGYNAGGGSFAGGVYTAPVPGIYHVDASVVFQNTITSNSIIFIYVGGSIVKEVEYNNIPNSVSMAISADVLVGGGQTIDIRVQQTGSGSANTSPNGTAAIWFNAHLIH